ncbi:guanine nucleotide exchange factor, putative [Entamoeba invadens IP1]|uniref:Guanine nucleotide exchange factor, putative n=1 Tax=Entamoeba invadens IP1 TaxID=370355 RepID=A0A0A1U235_ENTIV|nr:guanine nucleotide exchange factor, putative [Entamoeba invadens IP1]ELP88079.1 guanine nucleotide exchange factor, putative [Entamoeba invadens IP1]|eukprot:XP_004254850.1 guanine nucleotide exchange factor, putative [Entamoeba invadens IP1]
MQDTNFYSLLVYRKGEKTPDSSVVFQAEIERHLTTLKPDTSIPPDFREPTPGQLTQKQLEMHFPKIPDKIEFDTLDHLISFSCTSPDLFRDFIWGHRLFATTQEVLFQYLQRLEIAVSINCQLSTIVRARVVSILSYWANTIFPLLPEEEKNQALNTLNIFIDRMTKYGMKKQALLLKSQICKEKFVFSMAENEIHDDNLLPFPFLLDGTKPTFLDIPPVTFAKQITLISSQYFRGIELFELFLWNTSKEKCQALSKCVKTFNELQTFFSNLVLSEFDLKKRIRIIEHIVDIAYESYLIQNFDVVVCVTTLFSTSAIHRLKKTFEGLKTRSQEIVQKLEFFASPENNWSSYRKRLDEAKHTPCVPYIGLFLSDMLFTNDGNKTQTADKLINFVKCQKLSAIAQNVSTFQQRLYCFKQDEMISGFIKDLLGKGHSESDVVMFDRSRSIEAPAGKEKYVLVGSEDEKEVPQDYIEIRCYLAHKRRTYKCMGPLPLKELMVREFGLSEKDIESSKIVVVNKNEVEVISVKESIENIKRKYISRDGKGIVTMYRQSQSVMFKIGKKEIGLPIDISMTMNQLKTVLRVLLDVQVEHVFVHLVKKKPDSFVNMDIPLNNYVMDSFSMILMIPITSFTRNVKDSFLDSSYFYRYNTNSNKGKICLIHAHPFFIIKFIEENKRVKIIPNNDAEMVYLPMADEIHFFAENTEFTKTCPLIITGSSELIHQLISLYHGKNEISGVSVEYLKAEMYGLHPLFYAICNALYYNPNFFNDTFFSSFDMEAAAKILEQCETGEEVDLKSQESGVLVGMLYLYLSTLDKPLFGVLSGDFLSLRNTRLDDENLEKISKKLIGAIDGTMALSILRTLLALFSSWTKFNPYNLTLLAHFSKFFVTQIGPDSQLKLFIYLVQHFDEFDIQPVFPAMFPSLSPHPLSVDYVIRSLFDDVEYSPESKMVVSEMVRTSTKSIPVMPTHDRSERGKSGIMIGKKKCQTPQLVSGSGL